MVRYGNEVDVSNGELALFGIENFADMQLLLFKIIHEGEKVELFNI